MTSAAAVSAALRRAGFNPLGSGTSWTREGIRVSGSQTGAVRVVADLDHDAAAVRTADDVEHALTEIGYQIERSRPNVVTVTGR